MQRDFVRGNAKPRRKPCRIARSRRQALNDNVAHGMSLATGRSLPVDQIAWIGLRSGHRKIKFRVIERIDAIERLALLDAITDLLEHLDARALVDRRAGGSRQAIEAQAIDAGDDAIVRCASRRLSECQDRFDRSKAPARR